MRFASALSACLLALALSVTPALAASLDGLAVEVKNESEPVLCAEKDNVSLSFANKDVRSFRIEAAHPVYLSSSMRDNFEADWTACDMAPEPGYKAPAPPRKVTLYDDNDLWVVGYTFPTFWRPAPATVRIGDRVETGIHMLQIWVLRTDGSEEVLVFYPQDGYWRPRPMAPKGFRNTAYGSSFLVGPVEFQGRPVVNIKEVAFDPKTRTFKLDFAKGGSGTVKIVQIDATKMALDIAFDRAIEGGPFAMMRSMYITEFNNDVARIAVREKGAKSWREENIMSFGGGTATDIWAGRLSPSQHNTTSADLVFNSFSETQAPKRPKSEPPPPAQPVN
ncbi:MULTISPECIES: hypothetical protein [Rhodomicrobium]|uniref:hypothetical protein n=1 Tax=Rhodomicrobium TaxID=1068 RepID=UPI000B4AF1E4|nr:MULTISPECIES: hypothetical protein [Rhodomicrobium]